MIESDNLIAGTTKICPACKTQIPKGASKCPNCHSDVRSWFRRHPILTFILVLFLFSIVRGSLGSGVNSSSTTGTGSEETPKEAAAKLSPIPTIRDSFEAKVSFTGTQFVISNLDDLDCQNARMEVNGGILKSGYVLEGYTLETGNTFTVGASQFTKGDGTRFNPFETKPKDFFISCNGDNALSDAYLSVGW